MRSLWAGLWILAACASEPPAPDQASAAYQQAMQDTASGRRSEEILPLLDRAIELDPSRAELFFARAEALRLLRRPEAASRDYDAAIALLRPARGSRADLAYALLSRGRIHADAGRREQAEWDFGEAITLSPSPIEARLERARLWAAAGRTEEAERDREEARRLGQGVAGSFHDEGVHQLQANRPEEAERYFLLALDLEPTHPLALVGLARASLSRGRFAAAEVALTRAIDQRPLDAELYYHRGNARLSLGRYEDAFADFTTAIERVPNHAGARVARGILFYRHRKDPERSEAEFHRALIADPESFDALLNRGLLYHETRRLAEAEVDLRRALGIRADVDAAHALGRLLYDRGEYAKSADTLQRTLELCRDPDRRKAVEADLARSLRQDK
jgi:tetratricopeptide (TPR) repeat protein